MTQKELKFKRKMSSLIPTDNKGNLKVESKHRVSFTQNREKTYGGVFKKKLEDETYSEETYIQWNFGSDPQNEAERVEE